MQIGQGLDMRRSMGVRLPRPYFFALLAEAHAQTGQPEEALKVLTVTLAAENKTAERWWEAEELRLQGELLLAVGGDTAGASAREQAEACFRQALEIAHHQGAKSLELRAAMSLGRVARTPAKRQQARQTLTELYGRFAEGHQTPDLRKAKAMLESTIQRRQSK